MKPPTLIGVIAQARRLHQHYSQPDADTSQIAKDLSALIKQLEGLESGRELLARQLQDIADFEESNPTDAALAREAVGEMIQDFAAEQKSKAAKKSFPTVPATGRPITQEEIDGGQ